MIKELLRHHRTQVIAGFLAYLLVRFIVFTMRWKNEIHEDTLALMQEKKGFVICIWHNRLFPCASWWKNVGWKNIKYEDKQQNFPIPHAMITSHRDGVILSHVMRFFNVPVIVGSTNKDAVRAAATALRVLKKGGQLGITPDGPRGPRYVAKEGATFLSKKANVPIVLMSYDVDRAYILKKSWDNLIVPLPFSRATMRLSKPFYDLTPETLTDELNRL